MLLLKKVGIENYFAQKGKYWLQQPLQRIWAIGLIESWFCICDDLANQKIGLNLIPNPL